MRIRPSCSPRQRGGAIIEFALILTILVSVVTGILEFGRAFWYYDALSKATRNAARTLAVSPPGSLAATGVANARAEVNAAATSAGVSGFGTGNVSVTCLDTAFNTIACSDTTAPAAVRVSVIDYSMFLGSTIPFLVGTDRSYTVNLAPGTTMPYMR
jgi:Flp pilus assembly protein TadG